MPIQKITREEIISKCVERFRTHGFHSSTMSDLAEVCGLQKGSFYHYFTSKDEILEEGLKQMSAYFQEHIFAIAYNDHLPPKKRMKSMLQKHTAMMLHKHGGCIVANIATEALHTNPDVKPLLVEVSDNWHAALRYILQSSYTAKAAEIRAWRIIQDIEGAIMLTRLYGKETFIKQALQRSVEYCDGETAESAKRV